MIRVICDTTVIDHDYNTTTLATICKNNNVHFIAHGFPIMNKKIVHTYIHT